MSGKPLNRKASCHPDRKHHAKGLCSTCYGRSSCARWRELNPERQRENATRYRSLNKERIRQVDRARYARCSATWDNARKRYLAAHPERCRDQAREAGRRYRKRFPHAARMAAERRRALVLGSGPGPSKGEWADRLALFGGLCAYCPDPATTMDHCVPLSRGGEHHITNIVPSCKPCNSRKNTKLPLEWAAVP